MPSNTNDVAIQGAAAFRIGQQIIALQMKSVNGLEKFRVQCEKLCHLVARF